MILINESEVGFSKRVKEVKFGHWCLSPKQQTISDGSVTKELEPLIYSMLLYFIQNSDRIITRQELINEVWKQAYVDDNAINRAMSELRKALKSELQRGLVLKTHYRKGYSFLLDIEVIYHDIKPLEAFPPEAELSIKPNLKTSKNLVSNINKKYFIYISLLSLMIVILWLFIPKIKPMTSTSSVPITQLEFNEEILSWEKGTSVLPKASNDSLLIAYSFKGSSTDKFSLYIKNTHTLKQYMIAESNSDIFPIGWSKENNLYYQIVSDEKSICEIWRVDLSNQIPTLSHDKLFNCNSDEIISAAGFENSNKLIYTKYNYRDIPDLSAIVTRNLETEAEFQVSSPNNGGRGDYYVKISNKQDRIVFLRSQPNGTQIYLANIDGSHQQLIANLDYHLFSIKWGQTDTEVVWLDANRNKIISYNIESKAKTEQNISTEYDLRSSTIINGKTLLLTTSFRDINLSKINLKDKNPKLLDYSNTDLKESLIAPFNLSKDSIFLVDGKKQSLWSNKNGIRKKIKELNLPDIKNISISPDDTQLLITQQKKLSIYQLNDFKLKQEIKFEGVIKNSSWPLKSKILLNYAEKLKTNIWFYDLNNEKLIKLSNTQTSYAKLINDNTLLFFNERFQLIKKDIKTGAEVSLMELKDISEITWNADSDFIYYSIDSKSLFKKSLTLDLPKVKILQLDSKFIKSIKIIHNKDHSSMYLAYRLLKDNYIISLKPKNTL